eukprot:3318892-Rhodomonas_salina.1
MMKEEGAWVLWGLRGFLVEKEDDDGDRGPWSVDGCFGFRREGAGFRVFWLLLTGTLSPTRLSYLPATAITTCWCLHVQLFVLSNAIGMVLIVVCVL